MALDKVWLHARLAELKEFLCAHPRDTGESYGQHMCFALVISARLFYAAVVLCIHAFLPFLFVYTASGQITRINAILAERRARLADYLAHEAEQPEDA